MAKQKQERRGHGIPIRTDAIRVAFLSKIANGSSLQKACAELEIARSSIYAWLRDPEDDFREQFMEAREAFRDGLRDEIHRRAVRGVRRARLMGKKVVFEREYSDTLLKMMAQAHLPEYADSPEARSTGGTGGDVVNNTQVNIYLSDELLMDQLRKRGLPVEFLEE